MNAPLPGALSCAVFLFAMSILPMSILAQGSLTPPGPPAATMRTLDQLEPRIPISSLYVDLNVPGSYYLTGNLFDGGSFYKMTISSSGVTLDLNGHRIIGTNPSGPAIELASGVTDVKIINGSIDGSVVYSNGSFTGNGFTYGITYTGSVPSNVVVEDVAVAGCKSGGINLGAGTSNVIRRCTVRTIGGQERGLYADVVEDSIALECSYRGIQATVVNNCTATVVGGGDGSAAIHGYNITNSFGYNSGYTAALQTSYGIYAASAANTCYGQNDSSFGSGYGLYSNGIASGCVGYSNTSSAAAIHAATADTCYGYSPGGGYGISAIVANNCFGQSNGSNAGIFALTTEDGGAATNCYGKSNSGQGIWTSVANNCWGKSTDGTGIAAPFATNCHGFSTNGTGLYAGGVAMGSGGESFGGTDLDAFIAHSCFYSDFANITHRYNMP